MSSVSRYPWLHYNLAFCHVHVYKENFLSIKRDPCAASISLNLFAFEFVSVTSTKHQVGKYMHHQHVCLVVFQGRSNRYGLYSLSRTGFWPEHKVFLSNLSANSCNVHVTCVRQIVYESCLNPAVWDMTPQNAICTTCGLEQPLQQHSSVWPGRRNISWQERTSYKTI